MVYELDRSVYAIAPKSLEYAISKRSGSFTLTVNPVQETQSNTFRGFIGNTVPSMYAGPNKLKLSQKRNMLAMSQRRGLR